MVCTGSGGNGWFNGCTCDELGHNNRDTPSSEAPPMYVVH